MRIGILGGSFNPVHNGHIAIARTIMEEFDLNKILFMVAKDPPHKVLADGVSAQIRFELTQESLREYTELEASDLELCREGKSYTVDTFKELKTLYPSAELFYIVGGDMLITLPQWHEAAELMRIGKFIGIARPDAKRDLESAVADMERAYGACVYLSQSSGPDISSSMVRRRVYDALPISDLVPPAAERGIYERLLYFPNELEAMGQKLRAALKPARYIHTVGTVRCAIALAARYGADSKKARLAALLHDCGNLSLEQELALAEKFDVDTRDGDPALLHGPLGAKLAEREYGVTDEEILLAIKNHTLCRPSMTAIEKITYLSDKIEPGRAYEGVEEIREAAMRSLNEGVLSCMNSSIAFVEKSGKRLDPAILTARDYLIKEMRKEL